MERGREKKVENGRKDKQRRTGRKETKVTLNVD
jgi:hypothetical protein